jgi:sugar phosphate isomerase/epimerase
MKKILFCTTLIWLLSCQAKKEQNETNNLLFSRNNLVAWCIVPFDSLQRTPEERAEMLTDLGFTQMAYDWREQHLPDFEEEINALKNHNIKLKSVWMWIDVDSGAILDKNNEQLLDIIRQNRVHTDIWLGFSNKYFDGFSDDDKLKRAVEAVQYIQRHAKNLGCTISLYNHGDWFGDPRNQVRIIRATGSAEIGIIYNFHHAHEQIDDFPILLTEMLPYLKTVNINGMEIGGEKILPVGEGDRELEMLEILKSSGYKGAIGILGHVEDEDVKIVLKRNLEGLKSLLRKMGDEEALDTF